MDDRTSRDHPLNYRILWMVHTEEILTQIEIGVNHKVSFTRGYEDGDMQDFEGSQVVKLEAIVPQERVENLRTLTHGQP
jgi:hypothetical protein